MIGNFKTQEPTIRLADLPDDTKQRVWSAIRRDKPTLAGLLADPGARDILTTFPGSSWVFPLSDLPASARTIIKEQS